MFACWNFLIEKTQHPDKAKHGYTVSILHGTYLLGNRITPGDISTNRVRNRLAVPAANSRRDCGWAADFNDLTDEYL